MAFVAAGAILAMLADTLVPEAFETAYEQAGLITVAGFLAGFTLSRVVGGQVLSAAVIPGLVPGIPPSNPPPTS